jgi:hypothetical protein
MALTRSLYSTQYCKIQLREDTDKVYQSGVDAYYGGYLNNGSGAETSLVFSGLPVQTASIERTVPTEDILVLGRLGSVGRQQKEVETYSINVKLFWASTAGAKLDAGAISALTGNALNGTRSKISVEPNGFTGFGILTKFSLDGSVGNFITSDLTFEGFGTPEVTKVANAGNTEGGGVANSVTVWTSENVILGTNSGSNINPTETINSAKFSLDIPTETLSRIGAQITGSTTLDRLTGNYLHVAKPPFKSSISYEGQLVTGDHKSDPITFGHIKVTPVNFNITSQSYNQNAGDVGATMSFSSEGVTATFADA